MERLKVLMVPTWYPIGADKLLGIYHKEFASSLANTENIDIAMLYIARERLNNPFFYFKMKKNEVIEEKNYKVYIHHMLNLNPISFHLQLKSYTKHLEKAFLEYVKVNGMPDILHAQVTIPAGYACAVIGKKYHIPVLVTEHSSYFKRFFKKNNEKYGKFVLKNATYSTVSHYMKKEILNYTNYCEIIPNIVDTEDIFDIASKRKKDSCFRLVSVCALRQGKRIDDTIKAMKILIKNKKIKNIHLDVIGDGYYQEYYKQVSSDLKMNEYVTFLGKKDKKEIAEILKQEDALVISSDVESFSISGIEALASGIPVISTKCGGPEEYLTDKTGALCEPMNPDDMARAIYEVYTNLENYQPKELRSIAEQFSKENVSRKTIQIYKDMIEKYNKK